MYQGDETKFLKWAKDVGVLRLPQYQDYLRQCVARFFLPRHSSRCSCGTHTALGASAWHHGICIGKLLAVHLTPGWSDGVGSKMGLSRCAGLVRGL